MTSEKQISHQYEKCIHDSSQGKDQKHLILLQEQLPVLVTKESHLTTTKHASGLRSQWQEATTKNPERSPTEAECPRELDVRRAKRRASLGNEWGEVRTAQQWVGADRQTGEDLVCCRPLAPEAH